MRRSKVWFWVLILLLVSEYSAGAQERTFTITISEAQLNYIGKVIGKQPYEEARSILEGLQAQVNAQLTREANAERERIKAELAPKEDKQP